MELPRLAKSVTDVAATRVTLRVRQFQSNFLTELVMPFTVSTAEGTSKNACWMLCYWLCQDAIELSRNEQEFRNFGYNRVAGMRRNLWA